MPNPTVVGSLRRRLPDAFSVQLLDDALAALAGDNRMRAHHFAGSIRELFGHVLELRAPDADVRRCSWYRQEKETKGPTRKQRALYAARGGLPDKFIRDKLGLNPGSLAGQITTAYTELNKRCHVRPSIVLTDPAEIQAFANFALGALAEMFDVIEEVRGEIN